MTRYVFDEWYGELTFALRTAIRKYNVSPADYDMLVDECGRGNYDLIKRKIVERSTSGMYQMPFGSW